MSIHNSTKIEKRNYFTLFTLHFFRPLTSFALLTYFSLRHPHAIIVQLSFELINQLKAERVKEIYLINKTE